MNASETRCPSCNGILQPATDRPGLLECASCHTLYSPQPSRPALDFFKGALLAVGKLILVLAGLVALALGIIFAGCLLSGFRGL